MLSMRYLYNVTFIEDILTNCTFLNFFLQNILEMTVSDDDIFRDDDHAIVLFDVAKISLGKRVMVAFPLNPQVRTQSEV